MHLSEGLRTNVFPVATASGNIQSGICGGSKQADRQAKSAGRPRHETSMQFYGAGAVLLWLFLRVRAIAGKLNGAMPAQTPALRTSSALLEPGGASAR